MLATTSGPPDARAEPAARADRSRRPAPALGGQAIERAPNLVLQLIGRRAIHIELGADRIADRTLRRSVRRIVAQQKCLSLTAECFDAFEVMGIHRENEIVTSDE